MNHQELVSELLARPEDRFAIHEGAWHGKTVLITGAAGFIGSELYREVVLLHPARIITLDNNEETPYRAHAANGRRTAGNA